MLCVLAILGMFMAFKVGRRMWWRRHGGGGGWRRGGWRRRHPAELLFEELRTTPEQEKVIVEAFDEVRSAGREARGEWHESRKDVARAFSAESFDAEIMGNAFVRHDNLLDGLRKAVTGALARVHDVLDEKQRARLADLIARGPWRAGFGGGGFHPYR